MNVQNKKAIKLTLLWPVMLFCLLPTGCRDKSTEYYNRGIAYTEKGEYDQAILNFTKAIEINPKFAEAYYRRGIGYGKKGEYDRAIIDFTKAIEIKPKDVKAHYARGIVYAEKGEYDKALEDVQKAKSLGQQVPPEFLEELRNASGSEE